MAVEVRQLARGCQRQADYDLVLRRRGEQWVVHEERDEGSKAPVVAAVAEEVVHRHGTVGEAVNEEGLEDTLGVMKGPEDEGQGLHVIRLLHGKMEDGNREF